MSVETVERPRRAPSEEFPGRKGELPEAHPSILGLVAFATTTFLLASIRLFWPAAAELLIFPAALFFGGLAQFLAGMFGFAKREPLAAGVHGTWGAFWMALAAFLLITDVFKLVPLPEQSINAILGVMLLLFALPTFFFAWAAHYDATWVAILLHLLWIGTATVGVGAISGLSVVEKLGFAVLMLSSLAAFYTGGALVVNKTARRTILGIGEKLAVR